MPKQGKTPKGAPKLKRAGRVHTKGKYAAQFARTFQNKLRRVKRCNGPAAADAYHREYYARVGEKP